MKANIFYVDLTPAQRDELNAGDWSSPIGRAYLRAQDGKIDDSNRHLLRLAAVGDFCNAEQAFCALQNIEEPWTRNPNLTCYTDFPRSMSVGDLVAWADGEVERCASLGFEPINVELPA